MKIQKHTRCRYCFTLFARRSRQTSVVHSCSLSFLTSVIVHDTVMMILHESAEWWKTTTVSVVQRLHHLTVMWRPTWNNNDTSVNHQHCNNSPQSREPMHSLKSTPRAERLPATHNIGDSSPTTSSLSASRSAAIVVRHN